MDEHQLRKETALPDVDDMGPVESRSSKNFMRLFPTGSPSFRGGISEMTLVPVNPTSVSYKGAPGAATVTYQATSTDAEVIVPCMSYVETQVHITVQRNGSATYFPVTSEDRILLKNAAAALMWKACSVSVNDTTVSDQCNLDQSGASVGLAHLIRTLEEADNGYGASSESRAWVPGSYDVTSLTLAGAQLGAHDLTANGGRVAVSSIVGSSGGGRAGLEGYAWAQPPQVPDVTANAAAFAVTLGENGCRPTEAGAWARHSCLMRANSAANPLTMWFRPAVSVFQQPGALPPGSRLGLTLTKNDASMWIQASIPTTADAIAITAVRAEFVLTRLWVAKIRPQHSVLREMKEFLNSEPFRYSFDVRRVASFPLSAGDTQFQQGGILQGSMPSRVWCFLSRGFYQDTASANFRTSPWASSSASLLEPVVNSPEINAAIRSAGIPLVQNCYVRVGARSYPLEYSYLASGSATEPYVDAGRAYSAFLTACGRPLFGDRQPLISFEQFAGNYTFYCFSILPDPDDPVAGTIQDTSAALASTSGIEVYFQFTAAVPATPAGTPGLRLVVLGESPGTITISGTGGVTKAGL